TILQAYGEGRFDNRGKRNIYRCELILIGRIIGPGIGDPGCLSHTIRSALVVCPLNDVPFLRDKRVDLCELLRIARNELHNFILHGKEHPLFQVVLLPYIQQKRYKCSVIHLAVPSETRSEEHTSE